MEERIITATDLGSSKIAVTVARVMGRDVQVLYHKKHPARGIRYSIVFNPQQASEAVKNAIEDAERALNIKINSTIVGLPKYGVAQVTGCASVQRTDNRASITREEIQSLEEDAADQFPVDDQKDEMVFSAVPQSFSVGDRINYPENDIIGMTGETLSGNFKLFVGKKKSYDDLRSVFERAGRGISKMYFSPDITAKAVLTESEMENGVAIIDLGAGATSLTIYEGKILRYYTCIPFGGNTITNDIKLESSISSNLAEQVKLAFGVSQPDSLQNLSQKVIQINNDEVCKPKHLPVRFLAEIIEARITEIFTAMLYEIQRSGYADQLRSGVVLTGGGANLAGCKRLLMDLSGYSVRLGWPRRNLISAEGIETLDSSASAALGMILEARDDEHIISTKDKPTVPAEETFEPEEEEVAAAAPEQEDNEDVPGDLFGIYNTPEKKDTKIKKDPKPKKEKKKVSWGMFKRLNETINGVGELFGTIYDQNHDEDENA